MWEVTRDIRSPCARRTSASVLADRERPRRKQFRRGRGAQVDSFGIRSGTLRGPAVERPSRLRSTRRRWLVSMPFRSAFRRAHPSGCRPTRSVEGQGLSRPALGYRFRSAQAGATIRPAVARRGEWWISVRRPCSEGEPHRLAGGVRRGPSFGASQLRLGARDFQNMPHCAELPRWSLVHVSERWVFGVPSLDRSAKGGGRSSSGASWLATVCRRGVGFGPRCSDERPGLEPEGSRDGVRLCRHRRSAAGRHGDALEWS